LITHENLAHSHLPQVLKIICRDKPPTVKFTINKVPGTGMNAKYTTAMEPSYYAPTPVINDNPVNNKSFSSQYLETVLKITNNNGIFNNIMLLLLYQFIPIHPSIEYLQPEPEPPRLNSYFILLFDFILFIGQNKSGYIYLIIILSQQHAQFNPNPY
jgi:hypothetical protein